MANAHLTYGQVGNREDLSDILTQISPEDTPLFTMFGETKATGTKHEHVEDALANPAANAKVEGANYDLIEPTTRSRVFNYTQIFIKAPKVSKTQEAVSKAGVKSEMAHQIKQKMAEIKRDIEYSYVNNTAAAAGDASTARELGGLKAFISTEKTTPESLTETTFNNALQGAWENGGTPTIVLVNGTNKRAISAFTGGGIRSVEAGKKTLYGAVDFYDSDFGQVEIVPSRFLTANDVFILDKNLWKTAWLRKITIEDYNSQGSYMAKVIEGELTLEARGEAGNAWIALS